LHLLRFSLVILRDYALDVAFLCVLCASVVNA
jgi:hypothetical protein